jgi:hypothetical protein
MLQAELPMTLVLTDTGKEWGCGGTSGSMPFPQVSAFGVK